MALAAATPRAWGAVDIDALVLALDRLTPVLTAQALFLVGDRAAAMAPPCQALHVLGEALVALFRRGGRDQIPPNLTIQICRSELNAHARGLTEGLTLLQRGRGIDRVLPLLPPAEADHARAIVKRACASACTPLATVDRPEGTGRGAHHGPAPGDRSHGLVDATPVQAIRGLPRRGLLHEGVADDPLVGLALVFALLGASLATAPDARLAPDATAVQQIEEAAIAAVQARLLVPDGAAAVAMVEQALRV